MEIESLECFVAVAEELHFGRAAERLHRSPSAVSRSVKELERELGAQLFVRSHHAVRLASAGLAMLDPARTVLGDVTRLKDIARHAHANPPAVLRVGVPQLSSPVVVDALVEELRAAVPEGFELQLTPASSAELMAALRRGELDVVGAHLPVAEPGLVARPLLTYRELLVVRSDDELAEAPSVTLEDLAGRTIALPAVRSHPEAVAAARRTLEHAGILVRHLPDSDVLRLPTLVQHGDCVGVVWAPEYGGLPLLFTTEAFALVPMRDERLTLTFGLIWREGAGGVAFGDVVADRLTERLARI